MCEGVGVTALLTQFSATEKVPEPDEQRQLSSGVLVLVETVSAPLWQLAVCFYIQQLRKKRDQHQMQERCR